MELCYYWIDNRKDFLIRQEFNFGGEFLFKYSEQSKKLIVENNPNYIENFFSHGKYKNISNVIAIVGKNGGGKSTLLDDLNSLYYDGGIIVRKKYDGNLDIYKRILVAREDESYRIIFHNDLISRDECGKFNIKFEGVEEDKFHVINYGNVNSISKFKKDNIFRVNGTEFLEESTCIFFSNAFDANSYNFKTREDMNSYDISTKGILNYIEKEENEKNKLNRISINIGNHIELKDTRFSLGTFKNYLIRELKNKMKALADKNCREKLHEQFEIPNKLGLNMDHIIYRYSNFDIVNLDNLNILRHEKYKDDLNKIENLIYEKLKELKKLSIQNDYKSLATQTYLLRIIDAYFDDVDRFIFFKPDKEIIKERIKKNEDSCLKGKSIIELLNIFQIQMLDVIDSINNENSTRRKLEKEEFKKLTKSYLNFIEFFINEFITSSKLTYVNGTMNSITNKEKGITGFGITDISIVEVILDNEGIKLINNLINLYEEIYTASDFLKFEWKGISSGEDALFSMYSRFFSLKEKNISKNIVMLIDEGELYLHPEWQRKYLDMILDYLYYLFSEANSIQIFLTSNAPFLIADLPKNNVIFLDRYSNDLEDKNLRGKCRVMNREDIEQTFAANIHNLLINSFFMESTIGQFSEKKIREVIDILKSEKNSSQIGQQETEYAWKVINIIGEPILKRKLLSLYKQKFDYQSQIFMMNKIEELNRKIQHLSNSSNINYLDEIVNIIQLLDRKTDDLKKKVERHD